MDVGRGQREMYGFPPLEDDEIMQCMDELRIPIQQPDIVRPNAAHMAKVLDSFLDLLTGTRREDFDQPHFEVMKILEFPDLHLPSVQDMSFFRALRQLTLVAGIPDFSLKDLTRPEGSRVRLILSALINFAKFREMELANFEKLTEKTDQLAEQKNQLELEQQQHTEHLEQRQKQRKEEEPIVRELQQRTNVLAENVSRLNQEQETLHKHYAAIKEAGAKFEQQLEEDKIKLLRIQQECALLKTQLVQDPEKLKQVTTTAAATAAAE